MSMKVNSSTLYRYTNNIKDRVKRGTKNIDKSIRISGKSNISYNPARDLAKIFSTVTIGQAQAVAADIQAAMAKIRTSGADSEDIKNVLRLMGKAEGKARAKVRRIAKKNQIENMKKAAEKRNNRKCVMELEKEIKKRKRGLYSPEVNDISLYYGKPHYNDGDIESHSINNIDTYDWMDNSFDTAAEVSSGTTVSIDVQV